MLLLIVLPSPLLLFNQQQPKIVPHLHGEHPELKVTYVFYTGIHLFLGCLHSEILLQSIDDVRWFPVKPGTDGQRLQQSPDRHPQTGEESLTLPPKGPIWSLLSGVFLHPFIHALPALDSTLQLHSNLTPNPDTLLWSFKGSFWKKITPITNYHTKVFEHRKLRSTASLLHRRPVAD